MSTDYHTVSWFKKSRLLSHENISGVNLKQMRALAVNSIKTFLFWAYENPKKNGMVGMFEREGGHHNYSIARGMDNTAELLPRCPVNGLL